MYSEQMMREQGFDDAPNFRLAMYTDAIWRACRIILDVRMHRGELERRGGHGVPRLEHELRGRERPGRGQPLHVHADLPAVVPARQGPPAPAPGRRAAAPRPALRPAARSTTRCSTTGRCRSASTAGCCARRSPAVESSGGVGGAGRARRLNARCVQVIPSIDVAGGRSRVVFWPGVATGVGAPTDRPDRIAERFVELGARVDPPRRLRRRAARQPGEPRRASARSRRGSPSRSSSPAASRGPTRSGSPSRPGATRVVLAMNVVDDPPLLADCLARRRRLARGRARPAAGAARGVPVATARRRRRRSRRSSTSSSPAASPASSSRTAAPSRTRSSWAASSARPTPTSSSPAACPTSTGSAGCAIAAWRASFSARRSCPGPSTSPKPWRQPHDQTLLLAHRARRRRRSRSSRWSRRAASAPARPIRRAPSCRPCRP